MKPVMRVYAQKTTKTNGFEGFVTMPNLEVTRLRKDDGTTTYKTMSNLQQAARAAAKKYNATLVFLDLNAPRIAAKKSAR
jgi:3-deoxy-D-arabino-heptulosonate 7-phosphate (DAHP) synthase